MKMTNLVASKSGYRVYFTQNNGYPCSCCHRSTSGTRDFENEKETQEFITKILTQSPDAEVGDRCYEGRVSKVTKFEDSDVTYDFNLEVVADGPKENTNSEECI